MKGEQRRILDLWESKARSEGMKPSATHPDLNIRDIEIDIVSRYLKRGQVVLDIGCGNGHGMKQYSKKNPSRLIGIDLSPSMIRNARKLLSTHLKQRRIELQVGSVTEMPFENGSIDVAISTRCLINLATEDMQRRAILEIARVLKPGGMYLMIESDIEGFRTINEMRKSFGLQQMNAPWHNLKFEKKKLLRFLKRDFNVRESKRFGTYFFLTRLVHPLMVAPAEPKYEAKINQVAKYLQLGMKTDPFKNLGSPFFLRLTRKSTMSLRQPKRA